MGGVLPRPLGAFGCLASVAFLATRAPRRPRATLDGQNCRNRWSGRNVWKERVKRARPHDLLTSPFARAQVGAAAGGDSAAASGKRDASDGRRRNRLAHEGANATATATDDTATVTATATATARDRSPRPRPRPRQRQRQRQRPHSPDWFGWLVAAIMLRPRPPLSTLPPHLPRPTSQDLAPCPHSHRQQSLSSPTLAGPRPRPPTHPPLTPSLFPPSLSRHAVSRPISQDLALGTDGGWTSMGVPATGDFGSARSGRWRALPRHVRGRPLGRTFAEGLCGTPLGKAIEEGLGGGLSVRRARRRRSGEQG